MRIDLSKTKKKEIQDNLPIIDDRFLVGTDFGFGIANYDMTNKTKLHVSLVCLFDAFRRLEMARTALYRTCLQLSANSDLLQ